MDRDTGKVLAVIAWLGLMAWMVVACTLPVWTK